MGHNGGPSLEDTTAPIHIGEKFLFLLEPFRHKALFGGRGSAKSHTIATVLVLLSRMRKKDRPICRNPLQSDALLIVCARQFQNSIRDSVKELIEQKIKLHGFADEFDITEREIKHKVTGTRFIFIGLDRNPDSAKSLEGADICWVEEARTINKRSFEILVPTVRKPGSELWWSWNPEYREDPVDAYFRGSVVPPGARVQQVGIEDNPYFYLTELPNEMWFMQQHNQARYEHIWLGGYDDNFDTKVFTNVEIGRVNVPEYCAPRYGLDFGFGQDPSFLVKVYIIEELRTVYIAREWRGCVPLRQLPVALRETLEDESDFIRADSAQPVAIEYLETEGFSIAGAVKGPGSIKAGITWLQGYKIVIDPDCEYMREEARLYSWQIDKITKKVLNVPVDAHNHGWDAIRYACESAMRDGDLDDSDDGVIKVRL
ncbi:terminase large subunit [Synechococcus phage Ssp-JY38]|nr:terminase large subunit [Synechococcus phage Yong-L2-223]